VGVGDDQRDPGQAASDQGTQERQPAGAVLGADDVQAQDLALSVGVDPDGDQGVDDLAAAVLADLLRQGIDPDEGVGAGVQRSGAPGCDLAVEGPGHLADLRPRQPADPEGLDQAFHPSGRDA